jgi:hypothetical protein
MAQADRGIVGRARRPVVGSGGMCAQSLAMMEWHRRSLVMAGRDPAIYSRDVLTEIGVQPTHDE